MLHVFLMVVFSDLHIHVYWAFGYSCNILCQVLVETQHYSNFLSELLPCSLGMCISYISFFWNLMLSFVLFCLVFVYCFWILFVSRTPVIVTSDAFVQKTIACKATHSGYNNVLKAHCSNYCPRTMGLIDAKTY